MNLKIWIQEAQPKFVIVSIGLTVMGTGIAWFYGNVNLGYAILAGFGLLLTHTSANVLNDYFDFKSGLDLQTTQTPFSGGSGILPAGLMTPRQVFWLGFGALLLAIPVGIFFLIVRGWMLLPLLLIGIFFIISYSPIFHKTRLPEWVVGIGIGFLPILGMYFIQTGHYSLPVLIAGLPAGFGLYNMLILNEFPDMEADKTVGRRTAPILMGPKKAAIFYTITMAFSFVWITAWVIAGQMPAWSLLALLTLPLAYRAVRSAFTPNNMNRLIQGMADNIMVALGTQLLIGIGYILAKGV